MIHVFAIHTAKPGQRAALMQAVNENLLLVRAEPGCISYVPAIDIAGGPNTLTRLGPDAFVVVEQWDSREALQTHAEAAHMLSFRARVADLIQSRSFYVVESA